MGRVNWLDEVFSPIVMNQAWRRLRTEHTPWLKAVDRDQLQQHLLQPIFSLVEEVRNRRYRPEPLRQFTVPETDGRRRLISTQFLRDKFLQRVILIVPEPGAEQMFHVDSYAYRPHRGVRDAVHKSRERVVCGPDWLVDADIRQFFERIPQRLLKKKLKGFVDDPAIFDLMCMGLKQGAHHASLLGNDRGISQGAILSPLMCNIYLHEFDLALEKANIPFVRYADDFLLFSASKTQSEKALDYARRILEKLKLEIHDGKTQVVRSSPQVRFLGETMPSPKR